MHWKKASIVVLGILLLSLPVVGLAGDKVKFGKISDEEWQMEAPADYPEANSLILLDRAQLAISSSTIGINYLVRIKILTEAGIDEVGEQSISWNRKYDKIKKFKAHTITPDGKKHKVKKDAIFQKEHGSYKEKTFAFPVLAPGCIIEYSYRSVSKSFYYLKPWYFQGSTYTIKSSFSVDIPTGYSYNVLYQNVPPQFKKPKIEERPDLDNRFVGATIRTYTWVRENLPPITDEPYMSCENDYRSSLRFQIVKYENPYVSYDYTETWPELGEEQSKWFSEYCNKGKEVKKLTAEVTGAVTDPRAKSKAIYDYVTQNYVSSDDYVSRYLSRKNMAGLLEEQSGTPEEKNLLLAEMHQTVGLKAWPVMISTRSHAKFVPNYPDLRQFDHIIVCVQFDDGFEFLDCSDKLSPYGLLPPQCLTSGGLLIDGKESEVIPIRQRPLTSGRTDYTCMTIGPDNAVSCSTYCTFEGFYASDYAHRYESKEPEEFMEEYFFDRLDIDYDIEQYQCQLDAADNFIVSAKYSADELVLVLDDHLLIQPVRFAYRSNPFKSEKRFFPIDFTYPFVYKNVVEVRLHDSVQQFTFPEDLSLGIKGVTFSRKCWRTVLGAMFVTTLEIHIPEFGPRMYGELREFFTSVATASEDEITALLVTQ